MNFNITRLLRLMIAALLLTAAMFALASSQQTTPVESQMVTTRHQVTVAGRILKYTARAGRLPILSNDTGEVHAYIFFTAYTLDAPTGQQRPLTFLWNGGPGSSSSLVHLLGMGPRRLEADGTPRDNQGTWLEQTDLVFVDPVGTGYSRPTKAEYGSEFYQDRGDAESVSEFIRLYRNRFDAWDAPLFLAGESYGVIRAAAVADVLQRRGIMVDGVVLMGLTLPLGQLNAELRAAFALPTYTAAAYANKRLEPSLQKDLQAALRQSAEWSQTVYAPALARKDSLQDDERQKIVAQVARFSGLSPNQIDPKTLTIGMDSFTKALLTDPKLVVGRYDTRLIGPRDPNEQQYDPTKDPSLKNIINDTGVVRYFRNELQFESDLKYQGPFGGGYPPATSFRGDWMSVRWNRAPSNAISGAAPTQGAGRTTPPTPDQPLRRALIANPNLKVLVSCGYFDLICGPAANDYLTAHLEPEVPRNVVSKGYGGGHALYTDESARLEFKRDVAKFMEDVVRKKQNARPTGN